jgi:integrase
MLFGELQVGRNLKIPKLRVARGKYYCVDIYLPSGKRTTVGFGTTDSHTEGEILVAFGKWLDLYKHQPHKVLSYKSPYDAIKEILYPTGLVTVDDLLDKYLVYAERTIRKVSSNKVHPDIAFIYRIQRFLEPYKKWPTGDFGPDELYNVQNALVEYRYKHGKKAKRYTRRGVNDTVKWIRRIWKWGMGRHFVKVEQVQGLEEVKALRMGDTEAPDNRKRNTVTEDEFRKVLNFTGSIVSDMLKLMWYTAMRPHEVCDMRPYDILRDDPECWLYIPGRDTTPVGKHKTTRFERLKVIPLTSECQEILKPRINDFNSKQYIFSPEEAIRELLSKKSAERKTPLSCGNRPRSDGKGYIGIKVRDKYDHHSLRRACKRACAKAGVKEFSPYDIRRTAATGTRSILGKEAAKVLLGHTNTDTTEIYLLDEVQEAIKVAKQLIPKRNIL